MSPTINPATSYPCGKSNCLSRSLFLSILIEYSLFAFDSYRSLAIPNTLANSLYLSCFLVNPLLILSWDPYFHLGRFFFFCYCVKTVLKFMSRIIYVLCISVQNAVYLLPLVVKVRFDSSFDHAYEKEKDHFLNAYSY